MIEAPHVCALPRRSVNEFAAEIAFASGGAEWTEDLTGKSERVRVYRFPPPGWDALAC